MEPADPVDGMWTKFGLSEDRRGVGFPTPETSHMLSLSLKPPVCMMRLVVLLQRVRLLCGLSRPPDGGPDAGTGELFGVLPMHPPGQACFPAPGKGHSQGIETYARGGVTFAWEAENMGKEVILGTEYLLHATRFCIFSFSS